MQTIAFVIVAGFHSTLFLVWKSGSPRPTVLRTDDPGSGGMTLTLMLGRPGARLGSQTSDSLSGTSAAESAAPPSASDAGADQLAESTPSESGAQPAPDKAAATGGPAEDGPTGAAGAPGGGYNPWEHAVLPSKAFVATPQRADLWVLVQPCFHADRPSKPLTFAVRLDGRGQVLDTKAPRAGLPEASFDGTSYADVVRAALSACGPYTQAMSREIDLTIPPG